MKITDEIRQFVRANKDLILKVITERLDDFRDASINAPIIEDREKARLLALEFQNYIDIINDLFKPKKKKKDFTGV
jgi:hypothetical protein